MLLTLHPTFTFEVSVQPPDTKPTLIDRMGQQAVFTRGEFWDGIGDKIGCDEVMAEVQAALAKSRLGPFVKVHFETYAEKIR